MVENVWQVACRKEHQTIQQVAGKYQIKQQKMKEEKEKSQSNVTIIRLLCLLSNIILSLIKCI